MTLEEYYKRLAEKHRETDWKSLESVKEYNRYARELRDMMALEREEKNHASKQTDDCR